MAIYRLGDLVPSVDPDAFVHPDAIRPGGSHPELIALSAEAYVANAIRYRQELTRLDPGPM